MNLNSLIGLRLAPSLVEAVHYGHISEIKEAYNGAGPDSWHPFARKVATFVLRNYVGAVIGHDWRFYKAPKLLIDLKSMIGRSVTELDFHDKMQDWLFEEGSHVREYIDGWLNGGKFKVSDCDNLFTAAFKDTNDEMYFNMKLKTKWWQLYNRWKIGAVYKLINSDAGLEAWYE